MDQEIRRPAGAPPSASSDTRATSDQGTRPTASYSSAPPPRRRRFIWAWALLAAVVLLAIIWFVVSHNGQPAGGAGKGGGHGGRGGMGSQATTVGVGQISHGDVPIYLNELGAVTPLATVTVRSQISGYLQRIGFTEGQMVQKGQFLAQVDPRPYQAQLLQAQGTLARDEASLAEARLDLGRYQTLLSQDSIARQTVDQQAATVKQDEGTVKTDQAAIATVKLNLAYAHITSPVTGRVGLRQVDVGNYVSTGDANGVVIVTQITPMDVQFTLAEDSLPQLQARIRAGATLPVTATDRTGTVELAQGRLLTLDNQIDATTGTVKAKARFDNGAGTLFPQQFVNVKVLVDTLKAAVVAPTTAVLRGSSGLFVYVVQGGVNHHTVSVRNVKTGPAYGDLTAIVDGVQPGETVVTDGSDRLREGAAVILPGDCIPAAPAGGAGRRGGSSAHHAQGAAPAGGQAAGGRGGCPAGQRVAGPPVKTGTASTQQAQTPDQGGETRGPGGRMQAMLSQLDLDAAQQLKAQALFTAARGEVMSATANAGDDPQARRAAVRSAYGKAFDQLAPSLRPDQKAKLSALRAQMAQRQGNGDQGGGSQ